MLRFLLSEYECDASVHRVRFFHRLGLFVVGAVLPYELIGGRREMTAPPAVQVCVRVYATAGGIVDCVTSAAADVLTGSPIPHMHQTQQQSREEGICQSIWEMIAAHLLYRYTIAHKLAGSYVPV